MIRTRPDVDPKRRYNVRETYEALGVTRPTIKKYEREGHISFSVLKAGNFKFCLGSQIIRCWERTYLGKRGA